MAEKNCKSCDHFADSGHAVGTCRRFPQYQTRSPYERCGEFVPLGYMDAKPEMLALPVAEIQQTVNVPPNEAEVAVKRRGRPKKGVA